MSRSLRVEFDGAIYHVMSRGVGRRKTYVDDEDRMLFLKLVGRIVSEGGWFVHAFCVMPNHYHLLCETPRGELSRWMRLLNGPYAQYFNARYKRVGHLWQGRYKAILVEEGSYFLECSRYIHLNPNRSNLTRPAERYRWSSYRGFIERGVSPVDWVVTEKTLSQFDGSRESYREFVEAGRGEKPVSPFERAYAGLVLGGEAYIEKIRAMTRGLLGNSEQPALGEMQRPAKAEAEVVESLVDEIFGQEQPRRQRRLLLYGLRKHSRLRPSEIARRHGRSPGAVTLAVRDLDREAQTNKKLQRKLSKLAKAVGRASTSRVMNAP